MRLVFLPKAWRAPLLLLLLLTTTGSASWAQGITGFTPEVQDALRQAQRSALERAITGDAVPLEGAIDPESYTVGPGDVFTVSIGTALPTDLSITVSADGFLLVPSVGSFEVAGESLAAARAQILTGIRRSYRNVGADVALERPRQFYVHVAGTVPQPGRHVVAPVSRVEDAVAAAMGEASPVLVLQQLRKGAAFSQERPYLPALRSVEVKHRDGTTEIVDLWRYYTSGDLRYNPYVRDGDAIRVPAFRDDLEAIAVEGEVANAGSYDYREGDTVLDLLTIAVGTGDLGELGALRLVRRGMGASVTLDPIAIAEGRAENPSLNPGDRLLLMPRDIRSGVAEAVGYLEYPGSYPIRAGETTLKDLVEMAGGLRPEALMRGAYLERRGTSRSDTYEPDQPSPYQFPPLDANLSALAIELLFETKVSDLSRNSDLSFSGRQFYGRELLQPQRVSVDIAATLAGSAPSVTLQDGDRLVVPRNPNAVLVVGQVGRPGFVPFAPGLSARAYVDRAGGRGLSASKIYVRDATTGRIHLADGAALGSGDYVFVDREGVGESPEAQSLLIQERNVSVQRSNRYFQLAATTIGAAATIITIILTR